MMATESDTFAAETLANDLDTTSRILEDFFAQITPPDWGRLTDQKPGGWTLHQTLAHLTSATEIYHQAIVETINRQPLSYPNLPAHDDLTRFIHQQVALREAQPAQVLVQRFLDALRQTIETTRQATPDDLNRHVPVPWFRGITVAEMIGAQMAHPCLTHGAQLANGAATKPLWTRFSPDLLHRQLTRFFRGQMAPYYSTERGGRLRAALVFVIGGASAGRWHLQLSPEGARAGEGWGEHFPSLVIWVSSVDALLRVFTLQMSMVRAILTGRMLGLGNIRLGFRLYELFLPPAYQL